MNGPWFINKTKNVYFTYISTTSVCCKRAELSNQIFLFCSVREFDSVVKTFQTAFLLCSL